MENVSAATSRFSRVKMALGLDQAVIFTILARGWSGVAGLVTVILIAHFLSATQQGYYYTFGSLAALQIVFELGFSFVILQMASHERAHLSISDSGEITGDPVAHARLASVLQKAVRWYSVAALLMLCSLIPAGIYFFSTHSQPGTLVQWKLPWLMVALAASFAFQIDPIFSFLEGCGYVPQVAHTRFLQALIGSLLAWTSLLLHKGLFAPAMLITGQVLVGIIWLCTRRGLLLSLIRHPVGHNGVNWGAEVWPFQWRIAISWICGYFIFQLFNPILFSYWGPVAAGQMGMSLTIGNALLAISVAWVNTKSAPFGAMIARKEYAKLDEMFFRSLTQSLLVCVVGSLAVWSADAFLNLRHISFANRVLGPLPFGLLLATMIVNQIVFSEALYLRAHKQEKFLILSIINAALMLTSTYFLGRQFGAKGMVSGYLVISTVVGLGMGTYTFQKYRKLWHAI